MPEKKKKSSKRKSRLPPTGLGLMMNLDEETGGLRLKPEVIIVGAVLFMVLSVLALYLFPAA